MTDPRETEPPPPGRPLGAAGKGLFLARDRYRQRRLRDVARIMPVIAALLWLFPLLWRGDADGQGGTAGTMVFLFAAWAALIAGAWAIARWIEIEDTPDDPVPPDGEGAGPR